METLCLILVFLHILITVFAAINLHPHLSRIGNGGDHQKQILAIIRFLIGLLCISLYHGASIFAVWFIRRYGAGVIRATGILLIGELLHVITLVIQHAVDIHHIWDSDFVLNAIHGLTLLIAIIITFRLEVKFSKHRHDLMRRELLADNVNNICMDSSIEPTFL